MQTFRVCSELGVYGWNSDKRSWEQKEHKQSSSLWSIKSQEEPLSTADLFYSQCHPGMFWNKTAGRGFACCGGHPENEYFTQVPLSWYFLFTSSLTFFQWSVLKKVVLRKIAEKLWGGIMPKRFFPFYLLLVLVAGHFTNEFFVRGLDPANSDGWQFPETEICFAKISKQWSFRHFLSTWIYKYIVIVILYEKYIYTYMYIICTCTYIYTH